MDIIIERKRNTYEFSHNNKLLYKGRTKNYSNRILYDSNDLVISTAKIKSFFFKFYYTLNLFRKDKTYNFRLLPENYIFYKGSYLTEIDGNKYEIIYHRKGIRSIYQNNKQIGYVKINTIDFMYSERLELVINSDQNPDIICSMIFALECDFTKPTDIRINLIFAEKQVFNINWRPNN